MKKSILPLYLNMAETVRQKEKKYFGVLFCGINLPLKSGTTTSEHPADLSTYLNLQPTSEKYFYPAGKSQSPSECTSIHKPSIYQLSFSPKPLLTPALLTLIAGLFSPLRLINFILAFVSVIACTCSPSCTEYSCHQMISSLFTGLMLEPVKAEEFSPGKPSQQILVPIGLYKVL